MGHYHPRIWECVEGEGNKRVEEGEGEGVGVGAKSKRLIVNCMK